MTLATGSQNGSYKIWDVKEQRVIVSNVLKFCEITSVLWEPRSKNLIIGNSLGEVNIIDPKTKQTILSHSKKEIVGITKLVVSPFHRDQLFAASTDGSLSIYNLGDKNSKKTAEESFLSSSWKVHTNKCTSIAFSSQTPNLVISGGLDQRFNFYDLKAKRIVKSIGLPFAVTSAASGPNGFTLVLGGYFGELCSFDIRKPDNKLMNYTGHDKAVVSSIDFYQTEQKSVSEIKMPEKIESKNRTNLNSMYTSEQSVNIKPDEIQVRESEVKTRQSFPMERDMTNILKSKQSGIEDPLMDGRKFNSEKQSLDIKKEVNNFESNQSQDARMGINNYTNQKGPNVLFSKNKTESKKYDEEQIIKSLGSFALSKNLVEGPISKMSVEDKEEIKDFVRKEINNLRFDIIKEMEIQKTEMKEMVIQGLMEYFKNKSG